jgi:hypothetical protein
LNAALQITGVNGIYGPAFEPLAQGSGLLLSGFVERDVGVALPATGFVPVGLAVAGE